MIAADTDAEAERIASSADLHYARRAKGEYLPLASPEEAAAYPYYADRPRTHRAPPRAPRRRRRRHGDETVRAADRIDTRR